MQACSCKDAFGQLIWDTECPVHTRCEETMRGIPIRCVLVDGHKGNHL
jgi:hypothetical protein